MPCVFTCPSLGITMVAVKELKLGVGWCWASVPGQLCQQALLSVQSFIIFQQGLPTAWYGCCLFIYMYFNETSRARAWSTAGAMVSRSKRPADLSDGSCLNVLASFLHMWFVGFAATASDAGWSLRAGSLSVLSVSFLLLWFLFLLFFLVAVVCLFIYRLSLRVLVVRFEGSTSLLCIGGHFFLCFCCISGVQQWGRRNVSQIIKGGGCQSKKSFLNLNTKTNWVLVLLFLFHYGV